MPLTLNLGFEYWRAAENFVNERMQVSVTTLVRLTDHEITDLACSLLTEALYRQAELADLERSNLRELVLYAERVKLEPTGIEVYGRACAVVKATLRPEREGTPPRSLRATDFSLRALIPQVRPLDAAGWALTARDPVIDKHWNRGRFSG